MSRIVSPETSARPDRALRRDRGAEGARGCHDPRPLLPGRRDPGAGRLHRRQPEAGPRGHPGRRAATIVFCGVHFMAETAKMLNPEKRVLLPDLQAGCSLAESCPAPALARRQEDAARRGTAVSDRHLHQQLGGGQGTVRLGRHLGQRRGDHPPRARRVRDPLRPRPAPGLVSPGGDRAADDPLGRLVHGPRDLQRRRPAAAEAAAAPRGHDRAPRVPGQHPRAERLHRRHRGDDPLRRRITPSRPTSWSPPRRTCSGNCRAQVPRHRYHPVPGITCACNKCPHMARNTLVKLRDCLAKGRPEIAWQPEFDRAAEVLRRSLLD